MSVQCRECGYVPADAINCAHCGARSTMFDTDRSARVAADKLAIEYLTRAEKAESALVNAKTLAANLDRALRFVDPRNASAAYDQIAEDFLRETGFFAPGKDVPPGFGYSPPPDDELRRVWREYRDAWWERWFDRVLAEGKAP